MNDVIACTDHFLSDISVGTANIMGIIFTVNEKYYEPNTYLSCGSTFETFMLLLSYVIPTLNNRVNTYCSTPVILQF